MRKIEYSHFDDCDIIESVKYMHYPPNDFWEKTYHKS